VPSLCRTSDSPTDPTDRPSSPLGSQGIRGSGRPTAETDQRGSQVHHLVLGGELAQLAEVCYRILCRRPATRAGLTPDVVFSRKGDIDPAPASRRSQLRLGVRLSGAEDGRGGSRRFQGLGATRLRRAAYVSTFRSDRAAKGGLRFNVSPRQAFAGGIANVGRPLGYQLVGAHKAFLVRCWPLDRAGEMPRE